MINLIGTEFRDLTNGSTFGYRIYDNYGKDYYNLLNEPIEDDMKLFQLARIENPGFFFTSDWRYFEININGNLYKFEDIKEYL